MRCEFQDFTDSTGEVFTRPILFVALARAPQAKIACVVDTGSNGIRLRSEFGRRAGFGSQMDGTQQKRIAVGGRVTYGRTIQADLIVSASVEGTETYELPDMPVTFCEPWTMNTGLAGFPFLQRFHVVVRARHREFDIIPEDVDA